MSNVAQKILRKLGVSMLRVGGANSQRYPADFEALNIRICNAVKNYTMTNPDRISQLVDSVKYIVKNQIDGAMVECGVWKGGSSMAVALALMEMGELDRDIYLYDTYEGMSAPTELDVSIHGEKAEYQYEKLGSDNVESGWCFSDINEVKANMFSTNYPKDRLHFIKGKVEETIPDIMPEKIALLRLDTDWYESTKHELNYLYPRLQVGGVVIFDDYGYWGGAKKAIDEYLERHKSRILLHRIDLSARLAIKQE
jgi:hypothetical protein